MIIQLALINLTTIGTQIAMILKISKICLYLLLLNMAIAGCRNNPAPQNNTSAKDSTTFSNPLLASGPDPWVIQKDGYYYYTHTLGNQIALWKTKSMSMLKEASPKVVWTAPATGTNSVNLWAPELHFLEDKWYIYYTAGASPDLGTQRTFVLENTAADPTTGTWTDKGQIFHPIENYWAIDGTVLQHKANNYFIWSGYITPQDITQRIYIAQMSNPWTLTGKRSLLSSPLHEWEKNGDPDVNEGPEILKKNGKVFLIYSASGCWTDEYALGMLTLPESGDPLEPASWIKSTTPVFTKAPEAKAFGPGHNGFFQSPDGSEDWIIYHANLQSGQGCADLRSPRMQKFTWSTDGTPDFGKPVPVYTAIKKPSGE